MRVLAVDPGAATGMALYERWTTDPLQEHVEQWVEEDPIAAIDRVVKEIDRVHEEAPQPLDAIVCESFVISGPRAKEANQAIEIIGALRYLATKCEIPFITQSPADSMNFSTNAKLKLLGWYKPAPTDHARSATRHLLLYLTRAGTIAPERLLQSDAEVG